ncbi:MAG: Eco57I restriction-modification methylase domain-containing protein, partial [Bryobacteraceae bacterium]
MPSLNREHRRLLEKTVAEARRIAEDGARKVLMDQYAVHHHEPWPHMSAQERGLRNQLRAHGRQLGDQRDPQRETQAIDHLAQATAYEHWHRMLFARFLAENNLLLDAEHGVAMALDEVRELAREQGRDWMELAAELAQRMLLAVFRPDDPVLKVQLPPETRQQLEEKLEALPREIFLADDSLGWVYQFWQRDEKDRVNKAEVKIGADELPAVTQLFTEDYMVLFLLENTLGAWWTAKRRAEGKDPALPGYTWTYLRLNEDGSPAAGSYDGWPRAARDLRVLDPCMGSGHFLVFALPILARMRMEEEGLSLRDALAAVLRENLFGLEIDARCAQIAAFNLALAAWRLSGGHFPLPELNLACSGLGIHASEADWVKLAGEDGLAREEMRRLYSLFKDAPTLGSLIDPLRLEKSVYSAGAEHVLPLIEEALAQEQSEETRELAIAAQGVLAAFRILASRFTLVATNVPYLGRGKQAKVLADYCAEFHSDAKADLATCFVDRCLRFARDGGSVALVTPQNWLFLTSYKKLRERLLKEVQWDFVARLG